MPIVLALVLLVALGTVLARSEPRLNGTNSVPLRTPVVGLRTGEQLCQPQQLLTAGSGRLRMFLAPEKRGTTPKTLVTIRHKQDGVIARARGRYDPEGRIDVPIEPPVRRTRVDAEVCVRNLSDSPVALSGLLTPYGNVQFNGKKLEISLTVLTYAEGRPVGARAGRGRHPARRSRAHRWRLGVLVRRAGRAGRHGPRPGRRDPRGAAMRAVWLCALVGFLNAAAWAVWTPPLQSPDEPVHVYYVQYLAETGKVPRPGPTKTKSVEEQVVEAGVHRTDIVGNFFGRPLWTPPEAQALRDAPRLGPQPRRGRR